MILFILLLLSTFLQAQQENSYSLHGATTITFRSSVDWVMIGEERVPRSLRLIHPKRNLEVAAWQVSTTIPLVSFLRQQAAEQGICTQHDPFILNQGSSPALGVQGQYALKRQPYRAVLIAIPQDDSICLVRIRCPESCYRLHRIQINRIMDSLSVHSAGNSPET